MISKRTSSTFLLLCILLVMLSGCGSDPHLSLITISSPSTRVAPGGTLQLHAVGTNSSGGQTDLTNAVSWSSSNNSLATVDSSGLVHGISAGAITIQASSKNVTGTVALAVSSTALGTIQVTPATFSLARGRTQQLHATQTQADGSMADVTSTVKWASSDGTVAYVDASGVATAVGPGTTTLTATNLNSSNFGSSTITVTAAEVDTISITPSQAHLSSGGTQQFQAIATYSDHTMSDISSTVTWVSSNPAVLSITSTGLATAQTVNAAANAMVSATAGKATSSVSVDVVPATSNGGGNGGGGNGTPAPTSISILPTSAVFAAGTQQQFSARGSFADGTTADVSTQASWSSSNPAVVTVDTNGVAKGVAPGTATITGTVGSLTSTSTITITPAVLVSVAVSPSGASFALGTTQQFTVVGTFSNGTTQDLTQQAQFLSSNAAVLRIDNNGLATALGVGTSTLTATVNGTTSPAATVTITPAAVTSVTIAPATITLAKGLQQQLTATATFSDGTMQNVTNSATWSSSNSTVVGVSSTGLLTANAVGSAQITAVAGAHSATTNSLQVTPATLVSLSLNPPSVTLPLGLTQQFTATGALSDGTTADLSGQVVWTSSNPAVLTVDASGLAHSVGVGTATLTATRGGVSATTGQTTVTPATLVSVALTPNTVSLPLGVPLQLMLTGTYTDGSTHDVSTSASWSSSNNAVLAVDANGLATGLSLGSAQVTASYMGQSATTAPIAIHAATAVSLQITPATASIALGAGTQFHVAATFTDGSTQDVTAAATWSSSAPSVISVNSTGMALGVGTGTAALQASYGGVSASSGSVTGLPAAVTGLAISSQGLSLTAGTTQQLTAIATLSDGSTQNVSASAAWSSSSNAVGTVSSTGLLTTVGAGSVVITANYAGQSANTTVTVMLPSVPTLVSAVLTPANPVVAHGGTVQLMLSGTFSDGSVQNLSNTATWTSSIPAIASVSSTGLVSGQVAGLALVTADYAGQSYGVTVKVNPATLLSLNVLPAVSSAALGTTRQYAAMGVFSDGSLQDVTPSVTWSSSNSLAATVDANGLAKGTGTGTAMITATSGPVTGAATLNVTAATITGLTVTPNPASLPAGSSLPLVAIATLSDASTQDVSAGVAYASSNPAVAKVTAGVLQALSTGTTTLTGMLGSTSVSVPVTVSAATLQSIHITPLNLSLAAGTQQQLTATGSYSDGSSRDLSATVQWSSSLPAKAQVSSTGLLTSFQPGPVTVTATSGSVSGIATVTVGAATITGLTVSPASATLAAGQTLPLQATATLSDGTQQDATATAHWSVSNSLLGSVSNTAGLQGLFTALAPGTVNVQASVGSANATANVTVQPATLQSLSFNVGGSLSLAAGGQQTIAVIGHYSDGSTADLTAGATFSSSNLGIATVAANGNVHALLVGNGNITATVQGVSATLPVTVTGALLNSIAITPAVPTVALGLPLQLTATGSYTDGSTAAITGEVHWTTSNPSVATVDAAGMVTTHGAGSATVTGTLNGVSQQATLTVSPAALQSIAVTAVNNLTSLALGQSLQLKATGSFSDGSTQDISAWVTWSSSNPAAGVISSAGLATGVSTGSLNAQASLNGVTGSVPLSITAAVLQSITITPANHIILLGGPQQYTATGTYSDGSTQDLTGSVHWSLDSGLLVGSISSTGKLSPLALGLGVIRATMGTVSGTTGFTVVL